MIFATMINVPGSGEGTSTSTISPSFCSNQLWIYVQLMEVERMVLFA